MKGFEIAATLGLLAPAGTPNAIIERLHKVVVAYLQTPEVRERLFNAAAEPVGSTPEQFTALMKSDIERWGKVIRAAGIRADE